MTQTDTSSKRNYTYVIYKESTGEYYIGARSCMVDPYQDRYMGSSTVLSKRLGVETDWSKFIIQEYDTPQEMYEDEVELIKGHLKNGLCANISAGGNRWYIYTAGGVTFSERHKNNISKALAGSKLSEQHKANIGAGNAGKKGAPWKCPHCDITGSLTTNKNRWHFDKCKKNPKNVTSL